MATAARLVCGICSGSYRKPKILSCFHSFCEACLDSHIAKAKPDPKFQCPLCRAEIDIPECGARSLQNNFYIKTVEEKKVAGEKPNVFCENCDEEKRPQATKYCIACQQKICENCVLLHEKLKTTKSHELVNVNHVENPKSHTRFCAKHDAEVAGSYCHKCEEFVCAICRDEGHAQHFIEDTDTATARRKKDVQRALVESETYLGLVQHRLEGVIQNLKSVVKAHEAKAVEELEKTTNAWKENISSGVKASSLKITQLCDKELYKLDMVEKSMISACENRELIKKWILNASNEETLAEGARMQRKIMEVNFSLPSYIPPLNVVTLADAETTPDLSACMTGVVSTQKTSNDGSIKLELVTSFCLPSNEQILFIFPYKDRQVWMAQQYLNGLDTYKEDGARKGEMLKNLKISAVGLDSDWNLLACVDREKKIYKISGDHTVTTFHSLAKVPGSIAVCPDGRVVVCEKNAKQLVIVNSSGTKTPCTQEILILFNSIQCIAVCKYTNILAVVDKYWNDSVTVHLFDHRGQTVNKLENLKVFCIVSDNRGHFLLGCNNEVIIIDARGNKLSSFICMQYSFQALSLAVDTINQLWIGGKGQISIFKYLDVSISAAKTQNI